MSEISGVSHSYQNQVEAPAAPTTLPSSSTVGPSFDVGTTQSTGFNPGGAPTLRPQEPSIQEQGWAQQMALMSQSLDVVFSLMSAMMLKESNDMSRVAKELRAQQRDAAYEKDMAAADTQRENAMYGVIGSSVGAAGQAASAGMNMAGGIKGMQMTSPSPAAAASATPATSATSATAGTGATGTAATAGTGASTVDSLGSAADVAPDLPPPDVDLAAAPQGAEAGSAAELRAGDATQGTQGTDSASQQMEKLAKLDSAESQRLSARAQNLSLTTSGVAGIMSSTGEMTKGAFKYAADLKEAEAAEERADANRTRAMLDTTKEHVDKLQSYIDGMIRSQDEIQSNKNQTERNIWSSV